MKDVRIKPETTIQETLAIIDAGAMKIALVVDDAGRLVGTVTDGDIRRGLLRQVPMSAAVESVMNTRPLTVTPDVTDAAILVMMRRSGLYQVPVVDGSGRCIDLKTLTELEGVRPRDNAVMLMVGGKGMRLRPLTDTIPKPLLPVGERPLLETILDRLKECGFRDIFMSINYRGDMIRRHFGDGRAFGVAISYIEEETELGTAGALGLVPQRVTAPMIVMNGDILTRVPFDRLVDFHNHSGADVTVCVREFDMEVPYGVVDIEGDRVAGIREKPVHSFFISAGIYVLSPRAFRSVAENRRVDMPELLSMLVDRGMNVVPFPIREYWLDIGRPVDYERAQSHDMAMQGSA